MTESTQPEPEAADGTHNAEAVPASEGSSAAKQARGSKGKTTDRVLPVKAAEDDPRAWGDRDADHDKWLREQRPPHWG